MNALCTKASSERVRFAYRRVSVRGCGSEQVPRSAVRGGCGRRVLPSGARDSAVVLDGVVGAELQLRLVGADERCDVRVVSRGLVRRAETFVPLWSERFVVALPANHPLGLRDSVRAADLAGQRLVERCHCDHARAFARGRRRLEPVAVAESEEWALALVGAGVGIAIVPEGSARDDRHVVLRPIADVGVSRQVGLAWQTRASVAADVQRLCEKLQRRFGSARKRAGSFTANAG
jgi:DNA-binding transcriptional LysR family regulator